MVCLEAEIHVEPLCSSGTAENWSYTCKNQRNTFWLDYSIKSVKLMGIIQTAKYHFELLQWYFNKIYIFQLYRLIIFISMKQSDILSFLTQYTVHSVVSIDIQHDFSYIFLVRVYSWKHPLVCLMFYVCLWVSSSTRTKSLSI